MTLLAFALLRFGPDGYQDPGGRAGRGRRVNCAERRRVSGWLGLLAFLLQGCSMNGLEKAVGVSTSTHGEIRMRSGKADEILFQPEACLSGDRANFRGVDLVSPQLVLRVVAEPLEGLAVALIDVASGERRGVFRRSDCTVLRGDVQRTAWRVNNIADVSGFVEADCRLASGEELAGSITFEHCH